MKTSEMTKKKCKLLGKYRGKLGGRTEERERDMEEKGGDQRRDVKEAR